MVDWQPIYWNMFHTVALTFPPNASKEQQKEYWQFYKSFGDVIPCIHCMTEYKNAFKKIPLTSSRDLFRWTVDFHNQVNASLGKPQVSYSQAYSLLTTTYPKKHSFKKRNICIFFISIFMFGAILYFLTTKKKPRHCSPKI